MGRSLGAGGSQDGWESRAGGSLGVKVGGQGLETGGGLGVNLAYFGHR